MSTSDESSVPDTASRDQLVEYLRSHLVGPSDGVGEAMFEPPHRRYLMGVLYPRNTTFDAADTSLEGAESTTDDVDPDSSDDAIRSSSEWHPSSLGISMFVTASSEVRCAVSAGVYDEGSLSASDRARASKKWVQRYVSDPTEPEVVDLDPSGPTTIPVLSGRGALRVRWRSIGAGRIVTVSLVNTKERTDEDPVNPTDCLFHVALSVSVDTGSILVYPNIELATGDREESELRFLHRDDHTYAVGHGCSAVWETGTDGQVVRASSEVLPAVDVPLATTVTGGPTDVLGLSHLADPAVPVDELARQLHGFIDHYSEWTSDLRSRVGELAQGFGDVPERVVNRVHRAVERMRSGVELLTTDVAVLEAFRLANLAMLMEMRHGERDLGGEEREPGTHTSGARGFLSVESDRYVGLEYTWYPFQLAFILLVLESLVDGESDDRDIVDLLWFPTGGGKTEAYFAIAVFEIFHRRLRNDEFGGGLTVLTRYTMRLLTTQQFQRAASLICAAEVIRSERSADLGDEPITIGLWVGGETTPNSLTDARAKLDAFVAAGRSRSPFPLQRCPWCGVTLVPRDTDIAIGMEVTNRLRFACTERACRFSSGLPVSIVDDDVYRFPPTYLLATVDKFARLAWLEDPSAFFGSDRHPGRMGPSLLIQDEFHLLTGPLGTTAGLYEHAIGRAFEMRGTKPKVIASTATIRRASAQSVAIFGRSADLFPPSGLDREDSYFRRVDRSRPGRLYVGVLAPSHTVTTAEVHVAAALLQGPTELGISGDASDGYCTLVAYHNTLRDVGRTLTLARDDIPTRIELLARDEAQARDVKSDAVVELTGGVAGADIPRVLSRLEMKCPSPESIDVLATTNMMSVGVDVSRLALMLVVGQPKTASEYIQATSRVGRSVVPGLVVTLFSSTKPRDRSHYEGFVPFHSALYRHVEPTSVTPFSLPSRKQALAACLTILVRHGLGYAKNRQASEFDPMGQEASELVDALIDDVKRTDPAEAEHTRKQLSLLLEDWRAMQHRATEQGKALYYVAPGKQSRNLLAEATDTSEGWPTMNSMRTVELQTPITVAGEGFSDDG